MKGDTLLLHLFCILFLFLFLGASSSSAWNGNNHDDTNAKQVYIVYMGAADSTNASLRNDHAQILNSVLKRYHNCVYVITCLINYVDIKVIN